MMNNEMVILNNDCGGVGGRARENTWKEEKGEEDDALTLRNSLTNDHREEFRGRQGRLEGTDTSNESPQRGRDASEEAGYVKHIILVGNSQILPQCRASERYKNNGGLFS